MSFNIKYHNFLNLTLSHKYYFKAGEGDEALPGEGIHDIEANFKVKWCHAN